MYRQRLRAFVLFCGILLLACLVRLAHLQTKEHSRSLEEIEQARVLAPRQLPTVRGTIRDRRGRPLAVDRPAFYVQVSYQLTRLLDPRFKEAALARLMSREKDLNQEEAELQLQEELSTDLRNLFIVLDTSAEMAGVDPEELSSRIRKINDDVWRLAQHIAWRRKNPDAANVSEAEKARQITPLSVLQSDIGEMYEYYPLIELASEEQQLRAQVAFGDIRGIRIEPLAKRTYPYGSAACQILGWVGPAEPNENQAMDFDQDRYSRYLAGEVSGKWGVERACEVILRGRRGEIQFNLDDDLVDFKQTLFGKDVHLTLDIELQKRLEVLLSDPNARSEPDTGIGAVALDVGSGDVLAMVSTPTFDLSNVREHYGELVADPANPLANRALFRDYPPGSTAKPFILIAGFQEKKAGPDTILSCPMEDQKPSGFPNCLLFRKGSCHDWRWQEEGGNHARNAIRGSCNVYFSHLADRLEERTLQEWLLRFGFGRAVLPGPDLDAYAAELDREKGIGRNLPQSTGLISRIRPTGPVKTIQDIPVVGHNRENRWMGIGQGVFRATVLQGANGIAAIARGGIYKNPRLFVEEGDPHNESGQIDLGLFKYTLTALRDGMNAVVYKAGGTAHETYQNSRLKEGNRGLTLFGKTGSTQAPEHAWFAGWAEDSTGRAVAIAIVVEGGQSGSRDAAPLGFEMIRICNEMGYVGRRVGD
ncbi:MAG: hypothetical protein JW828_04035 [Sedimentisphaerales bacterium]|nr:hypothetical protein [Sedimentisphaerales bacterium]